MSKNVENFNHAVASGVERILSRANNNRKLSKPELTIRVQLALGKYLLRDNPDASNSEIQQFIDEMHADDLCLVIACENGDEKAWEDLVAGYDSTVKYAARRFTTNSADAEDLASSIWAELHGLRRDADEKLRRKLSYYSGRGSLAGWLRAVVSQLAIDQFRKQSKLVQIETVNEFDQVNSVKNLYSGNNSHSQNPETNLAEKRTADNVISAFRIAISKLEPEDRLIIKLYYFEGLKLKDVAATFGFHEATASRKLVRIQSEIRKHSEAALRDEHGWSEAEVKLYLSEAASKLGVDVGQLFAALVWAATLQVAVSSFVL